MLNEINTQVLTFSDNFNVTIDKITTDIKDVKNWQNKFRNIMLLGKSLPNFPEQLKTETALVQGCESNVWLYHYWQDNQLKLSASSDAKIVKGLITIILCIYLNKTAEEVVNLDIKNMFVELGIEQQLSPSRINGLYAITQQIVKSAENQLS